MPKSLPVNAIVVAGGMGSRMDSQIPKQFMTLKGKPVVQWSLECFNQVEAIDNIILVLPKDWVDEGRDKLISFDPIKPFTIVAGGKRRQDSVLAGIEEIKHNNGLVVIHDGARPAITPELVETMISEAQKNGNAVCAVPSHDTLIKVLDGKIVEQINRTEIFRVQTPQIFTVDTMRKALSNALKMNLTGTDDSSLAFEIGTDIHLVSGSELNVKITQISDLEILEAML